MCDCGGFEIDWNLKCSKCGKKPAISLRDPDTKKCTYFYKALCETCAIKKFGKDVVCEWAGTELYLEKYPDEIGDWR
jgi:hypothetical protein